MPAKTVKRILIGLFGGLNGLPFSVKLTCVYTYVHSSIRLY